jgi:hypothetical protein
MNEIFTWTFSGVSGEAPASLLIALWIGNPTFDLSGGAEVAGNNYSRVVAGFGDWSYTLGGSTCENVSQLTFPEAQGGDWGTITHVVILTNVGYGLFFGPLTTEKEIPEGSIPRFDIGDLVITLV